MQPTPSSPNPASPNAFDPALRAIEPRFGEPSHEGGPQQALTPDARRDTPDPGTRRLARVAAVLLFVLVSITFALQQMQASGAGVPSQPSASGAISAPVGVDPFGGMAKMFVKFSSMVGGGKGTTEPARTDAVTLANSLDSHAMTGVDRLRASMAKGFIAGREPAEATLGRLRSDIDNASVKGFEGDAIDMELVSRALQQGKDALSTQEQEWLLARHGYFARLLFAATDPGAADERAELSSGGGLVMLGVVAGVLLLLGVLVASLVCMIIAISKLSAGGWRPAFRAPLPGGSVFLEVVVALVLGFVSLKLVMAGVHALAAGSLSESALLLASLMLQWTLALVIFYPRLRGVPWGEARRRMGLHRGQGIMREIGAGVFAYFAGLPLFFLAVAFSLVVVLVKGALQGSAGPGEPSQLPSNPIIDIVSGSDWVTLLMFYLLATIWAPLVEEVVFRGCLYRHLRSRLPMVFAAILSAIVFGVMHGYEFIMLGPVIALGFNFAIMREWRGSIIGPMFAHAMHNGTVLIIAILAIRMLSLPAA